MLQRLHFTNFKSWPHANLEFGKITGLFGTHSSGKTSLLQFLLLLKQTKEATDRALALELNGSYVELGTAKDAVHLHDEKRRISFSLTFSADEAVVLEDPTEEGASPIASGSDVTVRSEIAIQDKAPFSDRLSYLIAGKEFTLGRQDAKKRGYSLVAHDPESRFRFIRTPGRVWDLPGPVKSYAFPDQARTYFQNAAFLAQLESAYESEMDRIFYLGPLRDYPRRDYLWARSRPTDVGRKGEKAIDAILAATEAGDRRNLKPRGRKVPFQQVIAYWLKEMGLISTFKVEEIKEGTNRWQAKLVTRDGAPEVLLTDVGFGVSQVLPVITLLYYVPEGSTVILEQPEIHLHPLAQANLADVIINVATNRGVQVILESHSEHLLLRLQRRIAEGALSDEAVKLYFCDAGGGESALVPLELDLFGRIHNWPDKFMGDAFTETAEAELARLSRVRTA